jgi:hypothetical protein
MKRAVENCFATCFDSNQIEFIFGIDDDDTESIETAQKLQQEMPDYNIEYTIWPRKKYVFSDLMNQCSKPAKGDIFNLMSDDAIHTSKDWDKVAIKIFNKYEDKIVLVQTTGGANENTGFPFMHRNWRDAAGYILAPIFNGDWGDYWLTDVMRGLQMRGHGNRFVYCPYIEIKHLHAEWGKMEKDKTYFEHYEERQAQEALPEDEHPYHGTKGKQMKEKEIENLSNFINNFKEKK